jgi:uncharacterized lipoprotein YmbA
MRAAFAIVLAGIVAATGCAWPSAKPDPTQFFVLETQPEPASSGPRPTVELVEVDVPGYLQNPHIAVRSEETRIEYDEYRRWAEPLQQGIARILKEDLAETADVEQAPLARPADLRLRVRLSAFEGLRQLGGASIRASASWEFRRGAKGAPIRGQFESAPAAWDGKDYGRLAKLLSGALAEFCGSLRKPLLTAPPSPAPERAPGLPRPR